MPPKNRNADDQDHGKVRIRWMEVEIEGANATLMDGIRQITQTMPVRVITRGASGGPAPKALTNGGQADDATDAEHSPDEATPPDESAGVVPDDVTASAPKRPRAQRSAPKAPALADYLKPNDDPSLRAFIEKTTLKKESSIMDQAIGIAMWLKEERQRDLINGSELCTCSKYLEWDPPLADPTSPMRNLKRDQKMNSVKGKAGTFTLTGLGEQHFATLKKK